MEDPTQNLSTITTQPELLDFLPRMTMFPGEDENSFEGLRHALLHDLVPATPYEQTLADNLVNLEWELSRHRNIRDNLVKIEFRKVLGIVIQTGSLLPQEFLIESERTIKVAEAYFGDNSLDHAEVVQHIATYGISEGQILAKAYEQSMSSTSVHENKIQGVEVRRRKLLDDYYQMKSVRAKPIEDAVVLGEE